MKATTVASVQSRRHVSVLLVTLTTAVVAVVLYLGAVPPESPLPGVRLQVAAVPVMVVPDNITIGARLIVLDSVTDPVAPFNYSREFARQAAAAPSLSPRRPDEPQRHFPFPFVSGDLFRFTADFVYDELDYRHQWSGADVTPCATVFVKNDRLGDFFGSVWPAIRFPVVLVSHNGDEPAPDPAGAPHLDDPRLSAWFAQNVAEPRHVKVRPIPIGLANSQWPTGQLDAWRRAASADLGEWQSRPDLLFISWSDGTNPIRARLKERFRAFTPDTVVGQGDHDAFLRGLSRAKFVLSPPGNGIDCHRHWEAILMGAVPIVLRSGLDPMFAEAPAVVVDDFADLREDLLRSLRPSPSYDRRVVWANYWLDQIKAAVQQCKADLSDDDA